jgi:hypothetical protein
MRAKVMLSRSNALISTPTTRAASAWEVKYTSTKQSPDDATTTLHDADSKTLRLPPPCQRHPGGNSGPAKGGFRVRIFPYVLMGM